MVATIFPVALFQHRENVWQARSTEMVSKAAAMLHSKVDPNALWSAPLLMQTGRDSPWYLLPYGNITVGGGWDSAAGAVVYADALNLAPAGSSSLQLFGADFLSDRYTPEDDHGIQHAENRVLWIGFYRRLANGSVNYAIAVCRQQRGEVYIEQDVSIADFAVTPTAWAADLTTDGRRFPVPWRVRVARAAGSGRLYNANGPELLGELAPTGSKIMIQGDAYPSALRVPVGRIYTVSDVYNDATVELREEATDLPADTLGTFDIWVFPPRAVSGDSTNVLFGRESPVLDWKVCL